MADEIRAPKLYGAIVLVFPVGVSVSDIQSRFSEEITVNKYDDCTEATYLENDGVYSWDVDNLLTILFEQCDFEFIKDVADEFDGYILVDIACSNIEGAYPGLLFHGKNMEIIQKLNASISVDLV